MVEWFWGFDISTKAISLAVLDDEQRAMWYTAERDPRLRWPGYLTGLRDRTHAIARAWGMSHRPTVVGLEQPLGRHPNPHLMAAWGVCVEVLQSDLRGTVILDLRPQQWRKDLGLNGNCGKDAVMGFALAELGYKGELQDEADALCIGAAARARWRKL